MINVDLLDMTIFRCQWLYLRMNTANLFTSRPWPIAPFFSICKFYRISRAKFGHDIPTPVLFTDDRAFLCAKCTLVKNWSLPRIEAWLRGDGATLSWLRDSIDQQGMTKACTRIVLRVFKNTIQDSIDQGMAIANVFASNCCDLRFRNNLL